MENSTECELVSINIKEQNSRQGAGPGVRVARRRAKGEREAWVRDHQGARCCSEVGQDNRGELGRWGGAWRGSGGRQEEVGAGRLF